MSEVATRAPGQGQGAVIVQKIDAIASHIRAALPEHVPFERFRRVTLTAIQSDPDLLRAPVGHLLTACIKAAQDGLLPDKREGAIVMFKGKPQWMPMVGGLMKLARNSGEVASIAAEVVYEGEEFVVRLGDEPRIDHVRDPDAVDRGKHRAVYAIATMRDGTVIREVMTWKQVMKVKAVSASGDKGPWGAWPDQMARKSVIRRLVKRLPLSTDRDGDARLQRAAERVDEDHGGAVLPGPMSAGGGRLDAIEAALDPEDAPGLGEDEGRTLDAEEESVEPWQRDAMDLIASLAEAADAKAVFAIIDRKDVQDQRTWLKKNHPEWADRVAAAAQGAIERTKVPA